MLDQEAGSSSGGRRRLGRVSGRRWIIVLHETNTGSRIKENKEHREHLEHLEREHKEHRKHKTRLPEDRNGDRDRDRD